MITMNVLMAVVQWVMPAPPPPPLPEQQVNHYYSQMVPREPK